MMKFTLEITLYILTSYEKYVVQLNEQNQANILEVTRLQEICKSHNFDFQPKKPKTPNRAERRATAKATAKKEKKSNKSKKPTN